MVKYSRYNQTMQIIVDYQSYLPTMSVITANHVSKYSKTSLILVGTVDGQSLGTKLMDDGRSSGNYTNYSGCISSKYKLHVLVWLLFQFYPQNSNRELLNSKIW